MSSIKSKSSTRSLQQPLVESLPSPPIDLILPQEELLAPDAGSERGKFRQLLTILGKAIHVKDLSGLRISLPGNLMEPIGNLEAWQYADRPDVFCVMGQSEDELERMLAVLRWCLTKDLKFVKHKIIKPYNSILGEHFHCHWDVIPSTSSASGELIVYQDIDTDPSPETLANANRTSSPASVSLTSPSSTSLESATAKLSLSGPSTTTRASSSSSKTKTDGQTTRCVFLNEQTSHHPPISHFQIESRGEHGTVIARGADQLSARFTGTTLKIYPGPHSKGIFVNLVDREEEYQVTHPAAVLAGVLRAAPYVTIAEQTYITCQKKGETTLRCIISYAEESWLLKPKFLLSGVIYRVESVADESIVKPKYVPVNQIVASFEGNWRGEVRWKKSEERTTKPLIDLLLLSVVPKVVAPLATQAPSETRKVWAEVTNHLLAKEYSAATKSKQAIEQVQREKAEARKIQGEIYKPTFFAPEPDSLEEWDGRPVLTKEGKAAIEASFKATHTTL